jgi:hypothetical protein
MVAFAWEYRCNQPDRPGALKRFAAHPLTFAAARSAVVIPSARKGQDPEVRLAPGTSQYRSVQVRMPVLSG